MGLRDQMRKHDKKQKKKVDIPYTGSSVHITVAEDGDGLVIETQLVGERAIAYGMLQAHIQTIANNSNVSFQSVVLEILEGYSKDQETIEE